jgi:RES domain-containing protein
VLEVLAYRKPRRPLAPRCLFRVILGETVALAVPSVLAPQEHNVVLNCEHPAFADLRIEGPEDFPFDPRLAPDARWQ